MSAVQSVSFTMLGAPGAVVCEGDACVVPGADAAGALKDAAEVEAQLSGLSARR